MRIALFITCYNDMLFPETGIAVVHVLERMGHTVEFPPAQTCCGQMHYNIGYQAEALPLVRRFVQVFRASEEVCVLSSSCVAMIREHYEKIAATLATSFFNPKSGHGCTNSQNCRCIVWASKMWVLFTPSRRLSCQLPDLGDRPEDLTAAARTYLRQQFLSTPVALGGANFLIAETGGVCIVE